MYSTSDLGAAAYLLMKECKAVDKIGRDIIFETNDKHHEEHLEELVDDYFQSEFHRFDWCIISLKKQHEKSAESPVGSFFTNDLGAAAYIMMHKYKWSKRGKSVYFEIDAENFKRLIFEYANSGPSGYRNFDSCLMSLKNLTNIQ